MSFYLKTTAEDIYFDSVDESKLWLKNNIIYEQEIYDPDTLETVEDFEVEIGKVYHHRRSLNDWSGWIAKPNDLFSSQTEVDVPEMCDFERAIKHPNWNQHIPYSVKFDWEHYQTIFKHPRWNGSLEYLTIYSQEVLEVVVNHPNWEGKTDAFDRPLLTKDNLKNILSCPRWCGNVEPIKELLDQELFDIIVDQSNWNGENGFNRDILTESNLEKLFKNEKFLAKHYFMKDFNKGIVRYYPKSKYTLDEVINLFKNDNCYMY